MLSLMIQKQKNQNLKVYAPNIHLFAYHLKVEEDKFEANQLLWDRCQKIFRKFNINSTLKIEERLGYRVDLLKKTNPQDILLKLESNITLENEQLKITGFAYPLRLHDTYILCLNLRRPEKEITLQVEEQKTEAVSQKFFQSLNPDGCFLPKNIGCSLGQTLLLTLWYPEKKWQFWKSTPNLQELRELADKCLENFIDRDSQVTEENRIRATSFGDTYCNLPEFNQAGELFNSPIFEYGFPSQKEDYCHILIWIFCDGKTDVKLQNNYQKLIDLFAYRNKVIQAYQDSRQLYQEIVKKHKEIETYLDDIFEEMPVKGKLTKEQVNKFKQYIKEIPNKNREYSDLIRYLNIYRLTIETNTQNYQKILNNIYSKSPEDKIDFLQTFLKEDCQLFTEQLHADLEYFKYGAQQLEQANSAIRARIEIDQAELKEREIQAKEESDRRLNILLAAIGTGIGVGGIIASSSGQVSPEHPLRWPLQPEASNHFHPFISFAFLSIIIGFFSGFLVYYLFQFGHWFTNKKNKSN